MPDLERQSSALSICFVHDGKQGHLRQLLGIEAALKAQAPISSALWLDVSKSGTLAHDDPPPTIDICIGAGHQTHWSLIRTARRAKAMSIVLMRPSLPHRLFDAIIAPSHDGLKAKTHGKPKVFNTCGPLNNLDSHATCAEKSASQYNLILLGGPSKHFRWDEAKLAQQVEYLITRNPSDTWKVMTSRRTPSSMIEQLPKNISQINEDLAIDAAIQEAEQVWVSPDSSNMIYETLSMGKAVCLLELNAQKKLFGLPRLVKAQTALRQTHPVYSYEQVISGERIPDCIEPLNEKDRAAKWLLSQYAQWRKDR